MLEFASLIEQKKDLFDQLAQSWQEATGGELVLLLFNGIVIRPYQSEAINPLGHPQNISLDWQTSLQTVGAISVPLIFDHVPQGYLVSYKTDPAYLPLLDWTANNLVDRLLNEYALLGMTDELVAAWNQLDLVYKITQTLGIHTNLSETLTLILKEVIKVVRVGLGFILFEQDNQLNCVIGGNQAGTQLLNNQTYMRALLKIDSLTLSNDPSIFLKFKPFIPPPNWQNIILAPIPTDNNKLAVLGLVNHETQHFMAGDAKLSMAVAKQTGVIIDSFRLYQQLLDQERVRRELEIAAEIQDNLLHRDIPEIPNLQIDVHTALAHEVGGDFYDFIQLDDDHLIIVLGEVAGKGIPSAMFTSMIRTVIRLEADSRKEPHLLFKTINEALHLDLARAELFITACVLNFNITNGVVMYANAGNIPGITYHAQSNTSRLLKATSTPIGAFEYNYKTTQYIHLNSGDTLILFSDGMTKVKNHAGESFGLEQIRHLVHQYADKSPHILRQRIFKELSNHQTDQLLDDISFMVIKFSGGEINQPLMKEYDVIEIIPFEYVADTIYLQDILALITKACRSLDRLSNNAEGDHFVYLVELAVSEICTNIIKHAYHELQGELYGQISLTSVGIQIDLHDQGHSFDPDSVPPPMSDIEGGYGLHIVRQIMDVAEYSSEPDQGNHWRLVKYLPTQRP